MSSRLRIALAGMACMTLPAMAQSASVELSASSATVAPGGTVTVTVAATFDSGSAGSGVFGAAGLFGFGGNVTVAGDSAADVTSSNPMLNGDLTFGPTMTTDVAPDLLRAAAGRGFEGGLAMSPTSLVTFDVTVDAAAEEGTFTVDYDGAVILVLGSTLTTYSTTPGVNQQTLSTSPLTLTVGTAGCNDADTAEPYGTLNIDDVLAFLGAFAAGDPLADIAEPMGTYNIDDVLSFLGQFAAGCP